MQCRVIGPAQQDVLRNDPDRNLEIVPMRTSQVVMITNPQLQNKHKRAGRISGDRHDPNRDAVRRAKNLFRYDAE